MIRIPSRTLLSLALLACAVLPAHAATWNVPTEVPTIDGALLVAAAGDTVQIDCGTYFESDLHVPSGVVLRSVTGQPDCVTLDAQGLDRLLYVADASASTRIEGLTLTGGQATSNPSVGGGAYLVYGQPQLVDCVFLANEANDGGGLFLDHCDAHLLRCHFVANVAAHEDQMGGAMYGLYASPRIEDCRFLLNEGGFTGSGVTFEGEALPELLGCHFEGNVGDGALFLWLGGFASLSSCTFQSNLGNAIRLFEASGATVDGCRFIDNQPTGSSGGAIYSSRSGPVSVTGSTFHANQANYGSAVYVYQSDVTIDATLITGGSSAPVYCNSAGGSVTLSCSDLWGNAGGDWSGCIGGQGDSDGNFSADPLYCDAAGGDLGLVAGSPCLPAGNPCGVQIGAHGEGCAPRETALSSNPTTGPVLYPNHPNPFNPATTLRFRLDRAGPVRLRVYDLAGRLVRTLHEGWLPEGEHLEPWDGRDRSGRSVASGVYVARLEAGQETRHRRMVLRR